MLESPVRPEPFDGFDSKGSSRSSGRNRKEVSGLKARRYEIRVQAITIRISALGVLPRALESDLWSVSKNVFDPPDLRRFMSFMAIAMVFGATWILAGNILSRVQS